MSMSVCVFVSLSLCVCLFDCITRKPHVRTSPNFFLHVANGRGLVLVWWHCDMLCTSGFMDDVMFSYHGTNGQTGTALCGSLAGRAGWYGQWPGTSRCSRLAQWTDLLVWLGARWPGRLWHWLFGSWTRLLPRTLLRFLPCALYVCSKLRTGVKVCYLWFPCLFSFQLFLSTVSRPQLSVNVTAGITYLDNIVWSVRRLTWSYFDVIVLQSSFSFLSIL